MQHGVVVAAFVGVVPLGEIEDAGAAQRGEVALQRRRRLGADEEQRAVGVGVPPRILERQARLADAADAVDDACDGSGGRGRDTTETIGELGDRCVAALEERAQAPERQIARPHPDAGAREDFMQRRTEDLDGKTVGVGEADFGMALDFRQPRQVGLLRGALRFVAAVARVTRRSVLRHGDQQRLPVVERQPRLPLRVGERRRAVFQEGRERWQAAAEVRVALPDQRQRRRLRERAGHVADEVDDGVAAGDVGVQLVERLAAGWDEVFLHLHDDVVALEVVTQRVAMAAKLGADCREEEADALRLGQGSETLVFARANPVGGLCFGDLAELQPDEKP